MNACLWSPASRASKARIKVESAWVEGSGRVGAGSDEGERGKKKEERSTVASREKEIGREEESGDERGRKASR